MKTKTSFDQSLEHCLQTLARTGDVEASLRHYPQHADQLRPLLEMAQATRGYYSVAPEAPGKLAAGRERLLAMAAQQRAKNPATSTTRTKHTGGQKMKLAFAMRLGAVLLAAIVGITALGGGVAWAASDSLPGDLLYPVKLVTEDARLALASAPGDQVGLALQFAGERSEEIQALAMAGRQAPDETVARMEQHSEQALTRAAWASSDEEMAGLLAQIAEHARIQAQMLERAQAMAPQQAQARLEQAVRVCQQVSKAAEEGLSDPNTFRWHHRHGQGTPEPTSEPGEVTPTPEGDQEPGQERHRTPEHECTPVGTPHVTPQGPRTTPGPQGTPHGPQGTPEPPGGGQGDGGQDNRGQGDGGQNNGGQGDGGPGNGEQGGGGQGGGGK